jgi:hypothetical protein
METDETTGHDDKADSSALRQVDGMRWDGMGQEVGQDKQEMLLLTLALSPKLIKIKARVAPLEWAR